VCHKKIWGKNLPKSIFLTFRKFAIGLNQKGTSGLEDSTPRFIYGCIFLTKFKIPEIKYIKEKIVSPQ
jgi:hypothetical protein